MRLPAELAVWVVDDDRDATDAVADALLRRHRRVERFNSAGQVRDALQRFVPGCLVVDLRLGNDDGASLISEVRQCTWPAPAVLISGHLDVQETVRAMRAGAATVLEKPVSVGGLCEEVDVLLQTAAVRVQEFQQRARNRRLVEALSVSQRDVLRGLLEGQPRKQIGSNLGIALRTVEKRRTEIYEHLQVGNIVELLTVIQSAYGSLQEFHRCHPS